MNWLRTNLFSSPTNSLLTAICMILAYITITPFFDWAVVNSNFSGDTPETCTNSGACWVFIKSRFNQFIYGFYPKEHQWRINITFLVSILGLFYLIYPKSKYKIIAGLSLLIIFPIFAFLMYAKVETHLWGGLHLTLVISSTGIVISLPTGILLALARRSELPIISKLATAFIELWRGVPLISVLFMASVLLPLFLPTGVELNKLLRALIGISLFSSAYMAEVVRGGIQAIPKGQYEAAFTLGFGYWQTTFLIILPQALKIVIPGIVNTFIGLFKDTTLVLIIGLFDLLGIVQAANTDPQWLKYNIEGYLFAGFVYWIFCFSMSRYSIYLENKFNTGRDYGY